MAILVSTIVIFDGVATGTSQATGRPWSSYNFRAPEDMNGIHANPDQMRDSNLRIFPGKKPACDFNQLIPGIKYEARLSISTKGNFDLISYQEKK